VSIEVRAELSVHGRPALEVRGISKRFSGVQALDRVDLDVRPGEVHVLLGENGAGKSTLMKILSGVHARDDGRIFLDGDAVEPRDPRHAQALGISIIYQTFSQAPHLTVAENLFLGREPLTRWGSIDIRKTRAMSEEALTPVGLSVDPDTPIKKLSVAQRQMVEIAKALSLNARVVIMDEPTSALTDFETRRLFGIIRSLRAEGRAVIYISHRLEEVAQVGDRVTVLRDGRRIGTLDIAQADVPRLIGMMVGRDLALTSLRQTSHSVPSCSASKALAAATFSTTSSYAFTKGRSSPWPVWSEPDGPNLHERYSVWTVSIPENFGFLDNRSRSGIRPTRPGSGSDSSPRTV